MTKDKLNWAIMSGHFVECFDATIYGFYAVMFSSIFFPQDGTINPLALSFLAFSAGFLARPLGAIVLGMLGDRFGRTRPLIAAMALVGVPTLIIGFLPSYEKIGLWATFTLFACRLAQGFFYGGEGAGVNVYLYENNRTGKRLGAKTGVLVGFGGLGAVFAGALVSFFTRETIPFSTFTMPEWAWRIPLILGGLAAFAVYIWRRSLKETIDFAEAQEKKEILKNPLRGVLRYKSFFLFAILLIGFETMPLYLITVFGNQLFREIGYSTSQSVALNMCTLIFDSFMIMLFGRLADRTGFQNQIIWGCVWTSVVALPAFALITYYPSTASILVFILTISTGNSFVMASIMPYLNSFFPANCRYSGVALSNTLGAALIAGNSPLIANYLIQVTGTKLAPAFLLIVMASLVLLGIWWKISCKDRHSPLNTKNTTPFWVGGQF